jgi:putative intracellular protease/amidase
MPATLDVTGTTPKRVLMVIANPTVSTTLGIPVGFWGAELTHVWVAFRETGYEVTIASPEGGKCELDAWSDPRDESRNSYDDVITMGFLSTPEFAGLIENTPALSELKLDDFDAIVVCGGMAPMFGFRENDVLRDAITHFYEAQKPTAALCHGVSAFIDAKLRDGSYLIEGKTMTGFANVEEDIGAQFVGKEVFPWRIENAARERGANFVHRGAWKAFAIRDGRLITGQQQYSGGKLAELMIEALGR